MQSTGLNRICRKTFACLLQNDKIIVQYILKILPLCLNDNTVQIFWSSQLASSGGPSAAVHGQRSPLSARIRSSREATRAEDAEFKALPPLKIPTEKSRPVFMVSDSVYIVFLDKCQPVTFFKVIYSPQKADAVAACALLCLLASSFYCCNLSHSLAPPECRTFVKSMSFQFFFLLSSLVSGTTVALKFQI